jgi:hypothetical protein
MPTGGRGQSQWAELECEVAMRLTASFEPQAEERQVVADDLAMALLRLIEGEP